MNQERSEAASQVLRAERRGCGEVVSTERAGVSKTKYVMN
jgi:hypothetical protein